MSITFDSDCKRTSYAKQEPCLCAQMSQYFTEFFNGRDLPHIRRDLNANADPNCPRCHGSGIEGVPYDDAPTINLASDNATILFQLLGMDHRAVHEMTLPEARRALMRACSRSNLQDFTRPEQKIKHDPREISPGVFDITPKIRFIDPGVDTQRIKEYLERFAEFLHKVSNKGAKKIFWY